MGLLSCLTSGTVRILSDLSYRQDPVWTLVQSGSCLNSGTVRILRSVCGGGEMLYCRVYTIQTSSSPSTVLICNNWPDESQLHGETCLVFSNQCRWEETRRGPIIKTIGRAIDRSCPTGCAGVAFHQPMVACHVIDCAVGQQIAIYDVVSRYVKYLSRRCKKSGVCLQCCRAGTRPESPNNCWVPCLPPDLSWPAVVQSSPEEPGPPWRNQGTCYCTPSIQYPPSNIQWSEITERIF